MTPFKSSPLEYMTAHPEDIKLLQQHSVPVDAIT